MDFDVGCWMYLNVPLVLRVRDSLCKCSLKRRLEPGGCVDGVDGIMCEILGNYESRLDIMNDQQLILDEKEGYSHLHQLKDGQPTQRGHEMK